MKEEKIGMYNIDEIYEVLTENVEGSFLNRSMVDAMIFKIKDLQSQLKAKEEAEKEFIKYLEAEKDRLAREVSKIYEDSLGKTKLVNEDIFNEVNNVLSKYKEIIGGGKE